MARASELPDDERALEARGRAHGAGEEAAWAYLLGARAALARGDEARAAWCHEAAMRALGGAAAPASLEPDLALVESELAAEAGDHDAAARLSAQALAGYHARGDEDGAIATWLVRAERALRAGQLAPAEEVLAVLLPVLDRRGDRDAGFWLRMRLAAARARAGRPRDAQQVLLRAFALTEPGSAERMTAAAETMRIWLDLARPRDALAIGAIVLAAPSSGARALHAEVLVLCGVALALLGEPDEAARFAERAEPFESAGLVEARARLAAAGDGSPPIGVK